MIKKITGLLFVGLLCGNLFAAEGGKPRGTKRPTPEDFTQQDRRRSFFRGGANPFFSNPVEGGYNVMETAADLEDMLGGFEDAEEFPSTSFGAADVALPVTMNSAESLWDKKERAWNEFKDKASIC